MKAFLKEMPKIQLHAHLTGSIPKNQLIQLLKQLGHHTQSQQLANAKLDISNFFASFFGNSGLAIRTKFGLIKLINLVLQHFVSQNVVYLEIRTTPRNGVDYTTVEYYNCIIEQSKKYQQQMKVKIIVSMNRGISDFNIYKTIIEDITKVENWKNNIVALDFSGDPKSRTFTQFIPIFQAGRKIGLKISIHTGEVPDQIKQTPEIFSVKPERVGHFNYYNQEEIDHLKINNIVVEVCISSNVYCKQLNSIHEHHIKELVSKQIKHCICSDDYLLFQSSISQQYEKYAEIFGLNEKELYKASKIAIDYMFDEGEREFVLRKFEEYQQRNKFVL